jgi:hypothetical protein
MICYRRGWLQNPSLLPSDAPGAVNSPNVGECRLSGILSRLDQRPVLAGQRPSARDPNPPIDLLQSNGMDAPTPNGIDVPKWSVDQPLEPRERPL